LAPSFLAACLFKFFPHLGGELPETKWSDMLCYIVSHGRYNLAYLQVVFQIIPIRVRYA